MWNYERIKYIPNQPTIFILRTKTLKTKTTSQATWTLPLIRRVTRRKGTLNVITNLNFVKVFQRNAAIKKTNGFFLGVLSFLPTPILSTYIGENSKKHKKVFLRTVGIYLNRVHHALPPIQSNLKPEPKICLESMIVGSEHLSGSIQAK